MMKLTSPFVLLVLANLSGDPGAPLPKLKERRLVTLTDPNFCQFMEYKKPRVSRPTWAMAFENLTDFTPSVLERRLLDQQALDTEGAQSAIRDHGLLVLHATWQGIKFLVDSTAGSPNVKVKVLDVSRKELLRDLQKAPEFDQSVLFRKVYAEGTGSFGGEPIGCLVGDYYLTTHPEDCEFAEQIAMVAAAACSPFLCGLSPDFFCACAWQDINLPFALSWFQGTTLTARWRQFTELSDGCYVFPLFPRFQLAELCAGAGSPEGPWINPGFLVAACAARAFHATDAPTVARALFGRSSAMDATIRDNRSGDPRLSPNTIPVNGEWRVSFEWDFPAIVQSRLAEVRLSALTRSSVQHSDMLREIIPAGRLGSLSLAHRLFHSVLVDTLTEYCRVKRQTDGGRELLAALVPWIEQFGLDDGSGFPFPFQNVTFQPARFPLQLELAWLPEFAPNEEDKSSIDLGHFKFVDAPPRPKADCQILVLADLLGHFEDSRYAKFADRRAVRIDLENFDAVVERCCVGYEMRLDTMSGQDPIDVSLFIKCLDDFEPEELARLIPSTRKLLSDRVYVVDLAYYASLNRDRWQSLQNLVQQRGALYGLATKLQGLAAVKQLDEDAPVSPLYVQQAILAGWSWFGSDALGITQRPFRASLDDLLRTLDLSGPGTDVVRTVLEEIDRKVSNQLKQVYYHSGFQEVEARWRAIKRLVNRAATDGRTELSILPVELDLANARSWKHGRPPELIPQLEGITISRSNGDNNKSFAIVVIDHCLRLGEWVWTALRDILARYQEEKVIVICGLDAGLLGQNQSSVPREIVPAAASPGAPNLVLVDADFVVRSGRQSLGSDHAFFEFGRGEHCPIVADLRASAVFIVAEAALRVRERFWKSNDPVIRREILQESMNDFGMVCRPFGDATLLVGHDPRSKTKLVEG